MSYHHITLDTSGRFAQITLDYQGKSANLLSQQMIAELHSALDEIETADALDGIVITSAKPSGFVFGADITEFETLATRDEVRALQEKALAMLARLEQSSLVSVALLHGPALGGGLELALACDYRLCYETGRIMAGFPEANLGLMPGFAGTARAARLIGGKATLALCLSAKPLTTQSQLLEYGLADGLTDEAGALAQAASLIAKGKRRYGAFCDAHDWSDLTQQAKAEHIAQRNRDHIPHLCRIIEHFEQAGPDFDKLVAGELVHFPELMLNPISANLRRVFALTDRVKKQAKGKSGISYVQVIGAGIMGADIAIHLCARGFHVYLCDLSDAALRQAYQHAQAYFDRKLGASAARAALGRFTCGIAPDNRVLIDLVIEAAPEKLSIKQGIWQEVEASHRHDCLFATNSSALDLDDISASMHAPERLLGLHFFNPATVMPLIEVIHRPTSDSAGVMRLMQLSLEASKLPVTVQNSPGFLVNRALLPYIFKAIHVMLEGANPDEIDQALLSYGMPMGPLELADQIGLDICLDVGERLGMPDDVKDYLNRKVADKTLGRKTGSGIYHWDGKLAQRPRARYDKAAGEMLISTMLAPLIAACQACLAEGHVSDGDMIDAAMIYGVGYPRHTGGPLHDVTTGRLIVS